MSEETRIQIDERWLAPKRKYCKACVYAVKNEDEYKCDARGLNFIERTKPVLCLIYKLSPKVKLVRSLSEHFTFAGDAEKITKSIEEFIDFKIKEREQ